MSEQEMSGQSDRPPVHGMVVDDQTRCVHYHGPTDVVAIKFCCCAEYYPCYRCHLETADHPIDRWPVAEHHRRAVMCGVCGTELPITDYLSAASCPACNVDFNPGCGLHHQYYFA